jgi:transcriptional pleiotropic regulator of transition state genes
MVFFIYKKEVFINNLTNIQKRGFRMKSTGIVRKVDELGRIVLPIELRRTMDIAERDTLEIFVEDDAIILRKYQPTCVFCNSSKGIVNYKDKNVCTACISALSAKA